jgi:hypothetical protein
MTGINYALIDDSDKTDEFEAEGEIFKAFFATSHRLNFKNSLEIIHPTARIEDKLKKSKQKYFNIIHLAAHGYYEKETPRKMDYSAIYQKRGKLQKEVFRADSIVRTGLLADVIVSTCCQTFNPIFIDIISNYKGVSNFIAPANKPYIGDTMVFSMMFYNKLLRQIKSSSERISDRIVIDAFKATKVSYKRYVNDADFKLYNKKLNVILK